MKNTNLPLKPILALLGLALFWGTNVAVVKIGTQDMAPLFMAGLRSLAASACLYLWMKAKKIDFFPSRAVTWHGLVVGLLFAAQFAFLYVGLQYTLASHMYIIIHTAPFFAALGAHFFLDGDRLTPWKSAGLVVAFSGVAALFFRDFGGFSLQTLSGDLMAMGAGVAWGATSVYLKKNLADRALPLQTLFYQLLFSGPPLLIMSLILEQPLVRSFSWVTAFSLFYQSIIIAFLSYLGWMTLIHRYPVSLIHAFSFFTPVFGVVLSGVLILGEVVNFQVVAALVLVSLGMVLANRRPKVEVVVTPKT